MGVVGDGVAAAAAVGVGVGGAYPPWPGVSGSCRTRRSCPGGSRYSPWPRVTSSP